ncbi:MAG: ABC transporter permease, partial [Microcystaceae cyanobacterium]
MDWWQRLKNNPLARFGAIVLMIFYLVVIAAEFVAPYSPCDTTAINQGFCHPQSDGSLLPPTQIYWRTQEGKWIGPHVYPTTQSPTNLETGERTIKEDRQQPSPICFLCQGDPYKLLQIRLPLPPTFEEVELFPGIPGNLHLFGTRGPGKINLLGTDEQGRDVFSRLIYGGRISLFIGLVGIIISFPLGMLIGGISGYFGGWTDVILMRLVEMLMTIPGLYLLVALAAVLPPSLSSAQRFLLIVLITSFISWSG